MHKKDTSKDCDNRDNNNNNSESEEMVVAVNAIYAIA